MTSYTYTCIQQVLGFAQCVSLPSSHPGNCQTQDSHVQGEGGGLGCLQLRILHLTPSGQAVQDSILVCTHMPATFAVVLSST
jgi:hypothetical protein